MIAEMGAYSDIIGMATLPNTGEILKFPHNNRIEIPFPGDFVFIREIRVPLSLSRTFLLDCLDWSRTFLLDCLDYGFCLYLCCSAVFASKKKKALLWDC